MDELRVKLTSKFMKGFVSKLLAKAIKKKFGCDVYIQLEDLDVMVYNGDTTIKTKVEAKINSNDFVKIMNSLDKD